METRPFGRLFEVSQLTLGGGGIGQVWGSTSRDEAIATVRAAYDAGIRLFDMAPIYGIEGEAETVMGLAFGDGDPDDLRVTTKCMLGQKPPDEIESRLEHSLEKSLARLKRDRVDLFFLHGRVIPDGWNDVTMPALLPAISTEWSVYCDHVVPVFEKWKASGRIGGWGITAAGGLPAELAAIRATPGPDAVQCITNLLDSPGSMHIAHQAPDPRASIRAAQESSVGVMGIRAVASGSLANAIDRDVGDESAEQRDFDRAAGYRALAKELGADPAVLAHRYALAMEGVDTLVLGVKNRAELQQCIDAANGPALAPEEIARIDAVVPPRA
ncbi:MAG: aldo/keto reductase [Myxococcota bacterium]